MKQWNYEYTDRRYRECSDTVIRYIVFAKDCEKNSFLNLTFFSPCNITIILQKLQGLIKLDPFLWRA